MFIINYYSNVEYSIIWLFKNNTVEDYDKAFTVKFSEVVFKICIGIFFISIVVMTIIGMI